MEEKYGIMVTLEAGYIKRSAGGGRARTRDGGHARVVVAGSNSSNSSSSVESRMEGSRAWAWCGPLK